MSFELRLTLNIPSFRELTSKFSIVNVPSVSTVTFLWSITIVSVPSVTLSDVIDAPGSISPLIVAFSTVPSLASTISFRSFASTIDTVAVVDFVERSLLQMD